jgi:hypothetical protein
VVRSIERRRFKPSVLVPEQELRKWYEDALLRLRERQGSARLGDYLEFGVFKGDSLSYMHDTLRKLGLDEVRLFGFDSFEGLPELQPGDEALPWKPGEFASSYDETKARLDQADVDWNRTFLVKGWYSDTLTPTLREKYGLRKASVVMVDCDLYSSTQQVLAFIAPLLTDESMVFFDDWDGSTRLAERDLGQKAAFDEFLSEHPEFTAVEHGTYYHTEISPPLPAKIFRVTRVGAGGDGTPG